MFPTGEDTAPRRPVRDSDSPRRPVGNSESVGDKLSEGAGNLLNLTKSVSGDILTVALSSPLSLVSYYVEEQQRCVSSLLPYGGAERLLDTAPL